MGPEATDGIVDSILNEALPQDGRGPLTPGSIIDASEGADLRYEIKLPLRNRTPAGLCGWLLCSFEEVKPAKGEHPVRADQIGPVDKLAARC